jgi:arginyl-tRNA synthetase
MSTYPELGQYLLGLKESLAASVQQKFPDSGITAGDIVLEKPPSLELGEFAYPCFNLAKKLKKNPALVAAAVAENFVATSSIRKLEAAGPYLNIQVEAGQFIGVVCETICKSKENFGRSQDGKGRRVMVEYSSPNTNKPLHIGHVRNNLIGMALANVLEFCGYGVVKANLVNDRGVHICKSMLAYDKWGNDTTPQLSGVKGDHLVGQFYVQFENALKKEREEYAASKNIALKKFGKDYEKSLREEIKACKDPTAKQKLQHELRQLGDDGEKFEQEFLAQSQLYGEAMEMLRNWEQNDPKVRALWQKMNGWVLDGFRTTYDTLGCKFDKFYYESDTYTLGRDQVEEGVKKGVFYRQPDGSIWVSADKLHEVSPRWFEGIQLKDKLLLRADGTSVYMTQDIGTAILKFKDFELTDSLYVVADEQILHFKILFSALKLLGFPWAEHCHHIYYGMVTLPHGMGKIKSREGTAVDADDLISEMVARAKEKMQEMKEQLRVSADKLDETALSIALAALKVFVLQVSMDKNIQFDPCQTIEFTGDTGPAIQYSHARICNMLRKAADEHQIDMKKLSDVDYGLLNAPEEMAVTRQLCEFPDIVLTSGRSYDSSPIANYLLSLTKNYARMYALHPVIKGDMLKAENTALRNARLKLAQAVADVIRIGMSLLGVNTPENM